MSLCTLKLIYLAAPYTAKSYYTRSLRAGMTARAAAYLMSKGQHVFAPTVHGHEIDKKTIRLDDDITYSHWIATGLDFLSRSDLLYVLALTGWRESIGVQGEIGHARGLGIPVFLMNPKNFNLMEYEAA